MDRQQKWMVYQYHDNTGHNHSLFFVCRKWWPGSKTDKQQNWMVYQYHHDHNTRYNYSGVSVSRKW